MMRSMFSSVSGLKAHQTKMDVIGNNIANVNTVGFKSSRVTFQDVFSQTLSSASAPDNTTGRSGTNPMQVGLGMGVASVDMLVTAGSVQRTDNPTDLSINGDGFLIVKGNNDDQFLFTRAGNLTVDEDGNLTAPGGYTVYGWLDYGGTQQADGSFLFDTSVDVQPINIYSDEINGNKKVIAAKATGNVVLTGNLNSSTAVTTSTTGVNPAFSTPVIVYDALGNAHKININFWKTGATSNDDPENAASTWYWSVTPENGSDIQVNYNSSSQTLTFNGYGKITSSANDLKPTITIEPTTGSNLGTGSFDVTIDFSTLTMFAIENSVKEKSVDGYPAGKLVSYSIDSNGVITGVYSNGRQQPLGKIALAVFDNPAGLERVGNNMFAATTNSGSFNGKGTPAGSGGAGTFNPGTLEMSNVDLAKEFTEMITTQRGFQANSRIITVSDEMLQELANMKR